MAGESDPLPATDLPNDKALPAEHTSPEDVSPDKPEDGKETFEHEVKRIDPEHFEPVAAKRSAAMLDELAPDPAAAPVAGAEPAIPGADPGALAAPDSPSGAVPNAPPGGPADAPPSAPPAPGAEDGAAESPSSGGVAPPPNPQPDTPQGGGKPVFDFENGLDPASRGRLVNDWQSDVDQKLFSRHTNVIKIEQKGNACTFMVQAFNTDTGAKPDLSTGYSADGAERGELMAHLREVFQPNGPAIGHVAGVYNDFIEEQADKGAMPLMRVKPSGSKFEFQPQERSIEGWSDSGMGRDPIWQATPFTVYTVALTIQFAPIGGQGV